MIMYYLDHSNKFLDEYTEKQTSFLSELPFAFNSFCLKVGVIYK